jgi:hypothetical protein
MFFNLFVLATLLLTDDYSSSYHEWIEAYYNATSWGD